MSLTYPLIAWGTPDDISASPWTSNGTVTVTGGQADPFGGTSGVSIDDTGAGELGARLKVVSTVIASGIGTAGIFLKQGTSAASRVALRDHTAGTYPITGTVAWSGGVPTLGATTGAAVGAAACGGGWYLCVWVSTAALTAGNTMRLELYATNATASSTGSTLFYARNAVLLDYVDDYRRFADKRPGYAVTESGSGVRDAWDQGTNYVRRGTVQWVPPTARSTPALVSGFTGANESTGVNCGVQAMLLAGMQMTSMVWVPDRSACSVNQSVYLTQPTAGWEPTQHPNGDFTFPLELVATSAPGAVA